MMLRVKQCRLMRGMSQEELAERLGVQQPFVSRIENGTKYPSIQTLCEIAKILRCEPNDLIKCD
jgi:transcriptional regulator with XRE-family HTH domain